MRDSRLSIIALVALVAVAGIVAYGPMLTAAGPTLEKKPLRLPGEDGTRITQAANQSASGTIFVLNYTTSFESTEGFTARDSDPLSANVCVQNMCAGGLPGTGGNGFTGECGFIGDGTQGGSVYPAPWGVSSSNVNDIEGHISNVHPFSGTQHLRISKDLCDNTNAFSFSVDARLPPSPPRPGIIAPATYSGQIALHGLFGVNVNWQPQSNSQGILTSRAMFFFYGFFYILDDPGDGLTFTPVFTYWDATGAYKKFSVHHDPCAKFICVGGGRYGDPGVFGQPCPNGTIDCRSCMGGENDGMPCVGDFQCPGAARCDRGVNQGLPCVTSGDCPGSACSKPVCAGGDCAGRIDYHYDGALIFQTSVWGGTTSEQFLIYTDNFPGDTDVDDLTIEVGAPCPTVCGNLEIEVGEQCDGANDDGCPGACVAPGQTGPGGETECTCVIPCQSCEGCVDNEALNGTNTAIAHGQWWKFTADTPAYGIELCGSSGFDSYLAIWKGTCNSLEFVVANDDCDSSTAYGPGSDPLASCFNRGGPGSVGGPYESCTCIATTAGRQYWVSVYGADAPGNVTNLTLNKRLTCDAVWENGACTDCLGNCVDNVAEADCTARGDTWVAQKLCATDTGPTTCGACCDASPGLGGACVDLALATECAGADQTFNLGLVCADITCTEVVGACCNGLDGTCTMTIQANCLGQSRTWTKGTTCGSVACEAVPGACCNHINPDPLALVGVCTDGVLRTDCLSLTDTTWSKATVCSAVTCDATFQAIPTVSEWGLVVLALLLLVGTKVAFARRNAAARR